MKPKYCLYFLLIIAMALSACVLNGSKPGKTLDTPVPEYLVATTMPATTPARKITWTETQTPSPTVIPPTITHTPRPTDTATLTPPATLEPEQAKDAIRTLLGEPVDCSAPCFWGIVPGQTTFDEAKKTFIHLGLQVKKTYEHDNKEFYEITYAFDSGLSISPLLTVQNGIVNSLSVYIHPEKYQAGIPREWLAYSPETLIKRYGLPSEVDFHVDYPRDQGAEPAAWYYMTMRYEAANFIIEYILGTVHPPISLLHVCPLIDDYQTVQLWLGKDPEYPPSVGVPLEEATLMTMEKFTGLMTGKPDNACFELKGELFP